MGVDIHVVSYRNGEYRKLDMGFFRNREFFDNISGNGYAEEYRYLIDMAMNDNDLAYINNLPDDYYGFKKFNMGELVKWCRTFKPECYAGWISVYDKWVLDTKHLFPDEAYHNIPDEYHRDNWVFAEWEEPYEAMNSFIGRLRENDVDDNEDIIIYFDC